MNEITYALYDNAEKFGLLFVLEPFGHNIRVKIPFSQIFCEGNIDELPLSVRSRNGLMRAGTNKIDKLIDLIMSEAGLSSIRNLGRKSISEIKTILLVQGYGQLNDHEKLTFWHDFVSENGFSQEIDVLTTYSVC